MNYTKLLEQRIEALERLLRDNDLATRCDECGDGWEYLPGEGCSCRECKERAEARRQETMDDDCEIDDSRL